MSDKKKSSSSYEDPPAYSESAAAPAVNGDAELAATDKSSDLVQTDSMYVNTVAESNAPAAASLTANGTPSTGSAGATLKNGNCACSSEGDGNGGGRVTRSTGSVGQLSEHVAAGRLRYNAILGIGKKVHYKRNIIKFLLAQITEGSA